MFPEEDMATLTKTYQQRTQRVALTWKWDEFIEKHIPRRCMLVSVGLILAGMSIPALMLIHLLPVTFFLGFVGFALAATGGIMALTYCGEI
jgi:hypothetical protein